MFDHNNHLAPVIYVADSPEQAINYKWDSRARGLNSNVAVLDIEEIRNLGEGKKHFYLPYDLNPGEVLIRHPYNQGYLPISEAEDQYLKENAEGIFTMARCLGATKIIYKRCNIAEFKREIDNKNGLNYKEVEVKLNVKNSMEQALLHKITMTRDYPSQDFTQDHFEKAKQVAEERGLLFSSDIRSLLDNRDPSLGKPMTHQTVNVEISSSLNKTLDVAFSLNTVPFFSLDSNTKIKTQKKVVLNVEWDIYFDGVGPS